MQTMRGYRLVGLLLLFPGLAFPLERAQTLAECAGIADNAHRLACYDRLAFSSASEARGKHDLHNAQVLSLSERTETVAEKQASENAAFSLSRHWELEPQHKRAAFGFRPHRNNYILFANYSTNPNEALSVRMPAWCKKTRDSRIQRPSFSSASR